MFSQTPPKNVPTLDTAGLVALITNPQKAAELWSQYEQHRKEYVAYKAEVDAAAVDVTKREQNLTDLGKQITVAAKELAEQQEAFAGKVKKLNEYQRAVEDREAALAATVAEKDKEFAGRQAALDTREVGLNDREAGLNTLQANQSRKYNEQLAAMAAREAAVAEREAKAEALAKLLKGV